MLCRGSILGLSRTESVAHLSPPLVNFGPQDAAHSINETKPFGQILAAAAEYECAT